MKPNLKNQITAFGLQDFYRSVKEMQRPLKEQLERLGPAIAYIGPSLLVLALWHSETGRRMAVWLFFVGCIRAVANVFRLESTSTEKTDHESAVRQWRAQMRRVAAILLSAWLCFSFICLLLSDPDRTVCIFLALGMLVPIFCIVPFFWLLTGRQLATVVFTTFSVFVMKLLGCVVVVLVYGWDASDRGYTAMPWEHPNLLVWLFLSNTAVLSAVLYWDGRSKFLSHFMIPRPRNAAAGAACNLNPEP